MKITEPEREENDEQAFVGKDLEIVQHHAKIMKMILKSMGIRNRDDRDAVIERIKKLIAEDDDHDDATCTDVWDKKQHKKQKGDDENDWGNNCKKSLNLL